MNLDESPQNADLTHRVEIVISNVLRWGVLGSLIFLVTGTLLCFFYSHDYGADGGSAADLQRMIQPDALFPFTLHWFLHGLAHAQGQAIIVAGLLLLIATPVARVAISIATFAIEKDWTYVVITTIVLLLLIASFLLGKVG